jgi:hypothetical protein
MCVLVFFVRMCLCMRLCACSHPKSYTDGQGTDLHRDCGSVLMHAFLLNYLIFFQATHTIKGKRHLVPGAAIP